MKSLEHFTLLVEERRLTNIQFIALVPVPIQGSESKKEPIKRQGKRPAKY
jgi:hypothetical protein